MKPGFAMIYKPGADVPFCDAGAGHAGTAGRAHADLAGICTARAADRARELAIRLSIGSTRGRIVRQLLTEAVVIALLGGAAGTALSVGMLRLLTMWRPIAELPIHVTVTPDVWTFAVALLLALASGVLPGLLPARQVWRTDAMQAMKKSGATAAGKGMRLNLRDVLLAVQIAVCALLVTCSLVALRGMQRTLHAPIGFEPENAMLVQMDMKMANYIGGRCGISPAAENAGEAAACQA